MTRVCFMIVIFAVALASGCGGDAAQQGHTGKTTDAAWAETLDAPYTAEDPCGYACNLGAYQCYATNTVQRCELVHGCAQWKLLKTCDMGYVCAEGNCLFSTPCPNGACDDGETACTCPDDCGHPPQGEWVCADNADNDCDGATDCDDPDCESVWPCETTAKDPCEGVECDDGDECTYNECFDGECVNEKIESCCKSNAECNDGNKCTTYACVNSQCVYDEKCPDDGNPCTNEGCNINGVCTQQPISGCGATCGNGKIETGEQCDDGNKVDDDCCTADCTVEPSGSQPCGVGECKIAVAKCNADGTQKTCTPKAKPQATETTCNDAKDNDCDGKTDCGDTNCSANPACAEPAVCGNSKCELGAEDPCSCPDDCPNNPQICEVCECGGFGGDECYCDDVCPDYGDCCADACEVCGECAPSCGNNVCAKDGSENCPACPDDCGPCAPGAACGDWKVESPEQCDDGNTASGDCCSASCMAENLGDITCGAGLCFNSVPKCKSDGKLNTCTPKSKPQATETTCTDAKDNDCDGKTDCGDTNCSANPACAEPDPDSCVGKCGENAGNCWCDATCLTALDCCADACATCGQCAVCGNGKCELGEDDCIPCDTDCPGCASPVENCTNGIDDDNDGWKDCADTADCPAGTACSDGNLCTTGDQCSGGVCKVGASKSCDDLNSCTNDSCDPATGACKNLNNSVVCLDNDPCTVNDKCGGGKCTGISKNCDDGDHCTADVCANGVCTHDFISNCCGNNMCETGETCASCVVDCKECDGELCTSPTQCESGNCITHNSVSKCTSLCDLGNDTCTVGCCQTKYGITVDGKWTPICFVLGWDEYETLCGTGPTCGDSICDSNENPCSCATDCPNDAQACEPCECGSGGGGGCYCDAICLDYKDCCANACATCGQCAVCGNGKCELGEDDCIPCDTDCPGCASPVENCTNGIDDDNDGWKDCADPDCPACSDSNLCTTDSCNQSTGACKYTPISCPQGQVCENGVCKSTCKPSTEVCDSKDNDCDGQTDECAQAGYQCQAGACKPTPCSPACGICKECKSGACVAVTNGSACDDDGNPCTSDTCANGACEHSIIAGCCGNGSCDGGETCKTCMADCKLCDGEVCINKSDCQSSLCPSNWDVGINYCTSFCNLQNDTCSAGCCSTYGYDVDGEFKNICMVPGMKYYDQECGGGGAVCGNGIKEGLEQCDGSECCTSICTFKASGNSCTSDGDACTTDACNSNGVCAHTLISCPQAQLCVAGQCKKSDGSPCTQGTECVGGVCVLFPDGGLCSKKCAFNNDCDPQGCCQTMADGVTKNCIPPAKASAYCPVELCADGVENDNDGLIDCADNSDCPLGTPCKDDGNVCTWDLCDGFSKCLHGNNNALCDDKNPDTYDDTCKNGVCIGKPKPGLWEYCASVGCKSGLTCVGYPDGQKRCLPLCTEDLDCVAYSSDTCCGLYLSNGKEACVPPDQFASYCKRGFGEPCLGDKYCTSDLCLNFSADGGKVVCTQYCTTDAECPSSCCGPYLSSGQKICTDPTIALKECPKALFGESCNSSADCSSGLCVNFGAPGIFCTDYCTTDNHCPANSCCGVVLESNASTCAPPSLYDTYCTTSLECNICQGVCVFAKAEGCTVGTLAICTGIGILTGGVGGIVCGLVVGPVCSTVMYFGTPDCYIICEDLSYCP